MPSNASVFTNIFFSKVSGQGKLRPNFSIISCGNCECNRNEREKPMYRPSRNNDLNWCMANADSNYHCSVSVILGVAEK